MTNVYSLSCIAMVSDTSGTDLEEINTEDERSTDIGTWSDKKRKKLQHMTEFHQEYQRVFGDRASLHTIVRKRISHMNPPIPTSVCKEEMQNAEADDVIVEYITDSKGNRVKKLKPLFIKSEPIKHMFTIYLVMMNYLQFQKRNSIKQEKLQLIPIVSLYHLMMNQVMIKQ